MPHPLHWLSDTSTWKPETSAIP